MTRIQEEEVASLDLVISGHFSLMPFCPILLVNFTSAYKVLL